MANIKAFNSVWNCEHFLSDHVRDLPPSLRCYIDSLRDSISKSINSPVFGYPQIFVRVTRTYHARNVAVTEVCQFIQDKIKSLYPEADSRRSDPWSPLPVNIPRVSKKGKTFFETALIHSRNWIPKGWKRRAGAPLAR